MGPPISLHSTDRSAGAEIREGLPRFFSCTLGMHFSRLRHLGRAQCKQG